MKNFVIAMNFKGDKENPYFLKHTNNFPMGLFHGYGKWMDRSKATRTLAQLKEVWKEEGTDPESYNIRMVELPEEVMNAWEAKKALMLEIGNNPKMLAKRGREVQELQGIAERLQVE